jgi:predicted TIM-barrel fold metal-dependent hydrolase
VARDLLIIDAQLHEPSVSGDWEGADAETRERALTEALFDYLDAVGVDGVLLHATRQLEWADRTAARYPDRVACVFGAATVAEEPDVEERVAAAKRAGRQVALRLVLGVPRTGEQVARFRAGVYDRMLAAMEENRLPLFLMATWHLPIAAEVAERHPNLTVILDHLGIPQPPTQDVDEPRFKALDEVVTLARHPNIAVKFSGAPGLSAEPYPFRDLWPQLLRYVEAFGPDRLMWGTDISRYDGRVGFHRRPEVPDDYHGKHGYAEALHFVRDTDQLSESDKRAILGGTAQRLLGWPRPA